MYRLVPDAQTIDQVGALPPVALRAYAEALTVLELQPWAGRPQHEANPDGPVRRLVFGEGGAGQVIYLVLEDRREVHLLMVQWLA